MMNADKFAKRWFTGAALLALFLVAVAIGIYDRSGPNSLLTGRWLLFVDGDPNPQRILEFSPRGVVTAYKLDGVTLDQAPGYNATWTVNGDIIEERGPGAKPVISNTKEFVSHLFSAKREEPEKVTRLAYTVEDDSTLRLELLHPRWQHRITLRRVAAE